MTTVSKPTLNLVFCETNKAVFTLVKFVAKIKSAQFGKSDLQPSLMNLPLPPWVARLK